MIEPWPHQTATCRALLEAFIGGQRAAMAECATGTGKALSICLLARKASKSGKVMITAHRDNLVKQLHGTASMVMPDKFIDIEMGRFHAKHTADVVIVSAPTIGREGSKRLRGLKPKLIIVDECHTTTGNCYQNIARDFGRWDDDGPFFAGFTATRRESDADMVSGKSIWGSLVYSYSILDGIRDGRLCPIRSRRAMTATSLKGVKATAGDYNLESLANAVDDEGRTEILLEKWKEEAEYRITLIFAVNVAHAQHMAAAWTAAGYPAEWVAGEPYMTRDEQERKVKAWRAGEFNVMVNCMLLSIGFDYPAINCIVMARPTKSEELYRQMVGRGTRICEGKEYLLIIDGVDNTTNNRLIGAPGLVDLPDDFDTEGMELSELAAKMQALTDAGVDVSSVKNASEFDTVMVDVSLFEESQLPPEVEAGSKLAWVKVGAGYIICGAADKMARIVKDGTGAWEMRIGSTSFSGKVVKVVSAGFGDTPNFRTADRVLQEAWSSDLPLLLQKASWRKAPVTDAQQDMLRGFGVSQSRMGAITRGAAAQLIEKRKIVSLDSNGGEGWKFGR